MFRVTMCPSSVEITVSMLRWCLSLCMGGVWSAGWSEIPTSRLSWLSHDSLPTTTNVFNTLRTCDADLRF